MGPVALDAERFQTQSSPERRSGPDEDHNQGQHSQGDPNGDQGVALPFLDFFFSFVPGKKVIEASVGKVNGARKRPDFETSQEEYSLFLVIS